MNSREIISGNDERAEAILDDAVIQVSRIWLGFIKNSIELSITTTTYEIMHKRTIERVNEFRDTLPEDIRNKLMDVSVDNPLDNCLKEMVSELPDELQNHPVVRGWKTDWEANEL